MCAKLPIETQISQLDVQIDAGADDKTLADLHYRRGLLHWRLGNRGAAMSDYNAAVSLDPDSPAAEALRMTQDIMDFYNTDLYNP